MLINWHSFSPLSATAGGVLIGFAASILILVNGRIAGISGIIGGLLRTKPGDIAWRATFVAGLIMAPVLFRLFAPLPDIHVDASLSILLLAGLLVGLGTRYASGCTSGHGVCGISRFSLRSAVATLTFMLAGFAIVFVMRHLLS